jgi:3-deoxy-D-manno-octulosonic-acid transferase
MYLLYTLLLALGLILTLPYWLVQMLRQAKYRAGLKEKLGFVPGRLPRRGDQRLIWVHAVSVGEVLAVGNLVEELRRIFGKHRVVISTTTLAGQKLARSRFGEESVFYFPLDLPFAVRAYLQALRPELIVIAETEFWPNFLRSGRQSGARIAVVNARISDQSWPGYRRWRGVLKKVLQNVDVFLAQSEEDKRRLVDIGAGEKRVQVSGNLKFDITVPPPPAIVAELRSAFAAAQAGPILVAGSTVDGEEPILLNAFHAVLASYSKAVMVLAPRHPERFQEVAGLLKGKGLQLWRRSDWDGKPISSGVLLLDSIGELSAIYSLADIAFVGGSLVPRGGHNIIEPAKYGVPILVGQHTENFRDIVSFFEKAAAVRIIGPAELPAVVLELLSNEAERKALGQRAQRVLESQMGATERTIDELRKLMGEQLAIQASPTRGAAQ